MHSLVKELMTLRADADLASDVRQQVLRRAMAIDPDKVVGLDSIVQDAVALKFTSAPLTKEQLAELMQIPPRQ